MEINSLVQIFGSAGVTFYVMWLWLQSVQAEKKGIINGALVGLIYILTIYIISSIAKGNFGITINSIILIASAIIAGMLGGIIGVNIKNR